MAAIKNPIQGSRKYLKKSNKSQEIEKKEKGKKIK